MFADLLADLDHVDGTQWRTRVAVAKSDKRIETTTPKVVLSCEEVVQHSKTPDSSSLDSDDQVFAQLDLDSVVSSSPKTETSGKLATGATNPHESRGPVCCLQPAGETHLADQSCATCCGNQLQKASRCTAEEKSEQYQQQPQLVNKSSRNCAVLKVADLPDKIKNSLDSIFDYDICEGSATKPKASGSNSLNVNVSGSVSFRDRLKQTLQKNGTVATPLSNRLKKCKEKKLEEVLNEAAVLLQEGTEFDIGPFYGLPSKVQELLISQKGISELYGRPSAKLSTLMHILHISNTV